MDEARPPKWTRESAFEFIAFLAPTLLAAGYHVGLAGSVLTIGHSRKDLDLVLFPRSTEHDDREVLYTALREAGLWRLFDVDVVRARWRSLGSNDQKHVEVWAFERRRIDFFFLK